MAEITIFKTHLGFLKILCLSTTRTPLVLKSETQCRVQQSMVKERPALSHALDGECGSVYSILDMRRHVMICIW